MARLLCERGRLGPQKLLVPRNRWWVVSWPWRCTLLHELTKELRLLVAPSQHGRNGLSQIRRVRWFHHSAFSHGWISPIILITKQSTMEECRKRKLNKKARNLLQPNPDYTDSHPEYPDSPPGLSGPKSGVSGYITRPEVLHNSIRNIRTTIRNVRTQHSDYPDLCPEYPDTPVVFHFVLTSKIHEIFKTMNDMMHNRPTVTS